MKIYTKTGDKGTTQLIGGERVPKDDPRVEAYGTVDELTAVVALLRDNMDLAQTALDDYHDDLAVILNQLMSIEAVLAAGEGGAGKVPVISDESVSYLEGRIDYIQQEVKPIDKFTIPGGHPLVSYAHLARTICRRAERAAVTVSRQYRIQENAVIYLNRLSDYLYQLGRKLSDEFNVEEIQWIPDK